MEFVTFEIAKKLKEKGFDCKYPLAMYDEGGLFYPLFTSCDEDENSNCIFGKRLYYDYEDFLDNKSAIISPTISQVLKWLREEKGWVVVVRLFSTNGWYWFIQDKNGELYSSHLVSCDDCFSAYEDAALAGINYVLNNLI